MTRVDKVVIPAAGLGTRFLPATKAVPKELLPIVDVPTIQYIVDEAVRAGISDVILVNGRGKGALEDHFDVAYELEAVLQARGKTEVQQQLRAISDLTRIISVRQKHPKGLGHAVLCAASVVGPNPFGVMLGDDLIDSQIPAIQQLIEVYQRHQKGVVALMEVPLAEAPLYGIAGGKPLDDRTIAIEELVEKPAPERAPSRLAVIGRYVLPPSIFEILRNTPPGVGGEIQLTDALATLAKTEGLLGYRFSGDRYDAGERLGYLKANLAFALKRSDLRAPLIAYLKELVAGIEGSPPTNAEAIAFAADAAGQPFARVAVLAPVRGLFTYRLPPALSFGASPGTRVRVPFGRRELSGFVVDRTAEPPDAIEIREVQGLPDGDGARLLPEPLFRLLLWAAEYYLHPPGEVIKAALPKGLFEPPRARRRKKASSLESPSESLVADPEYTPSPAQRAAGEALDQALTAGGFAPFLLQGVTGSGKTEVYLRAIERALELGKSALVLVPEISLTPQLVARFQGRLGHTLALLHSGLTPSARLDAWQRLRSGAARVAVGVRAAAFAPLPDLGLIVVDEEHDPSFKQEERFCYHARDMAVARAKFERCAVVLGSATPSLESYANAAAGRYVKLTLPERIDERPMPRVELLDLCRQGSKPTDLLLERLRDGLSDVLARGEQAILFLNRRGHTGCLLCRTCGLVQTCPNCSVTLTQHRARRCLLCHYCGHQRPVPAACPECRGALTPLGAGTERVEEEIARLFPQARLGRVDSDCSASAVERTLGDFGKGRLDLLVGTQVVAKGHDFPGVTLVGVILADSGLHFPDFRAAERSFQLLVQVAGRAGRGNLPGRVLVQTYHPSHPVILAAASQDYEAFAQAELDRRRALGFPPSGRLCAIRVDAVKPAAAEGAARQLARLAGDQLRRSGGRAAVLGPAPAPLTKLRGRTRWQLLVRGESHRQIRELVRPLQDALLSLGPVRVAFDMDPLAML